MQSSGQSEQLYLSRIISSAACSLCQRCVVLSNRLLRLRLRLRLSLSLLCLDLCLLGFHGL